MKKTFICLVLLVITNNVSANYLKSNSFENQLTTLTKSNLIQKFKDAGYNFCYYKNHKARNIENSFFIFNKIIPQNKLDNRGTKILVVCKHDLKDKYQILYIVEDLIYSAGSTDTCYFGTNKEPFEKVDTKGFYITIEQNNCTGTNGEIVHEYFTFKFDERLNEYFLNKYSIEIITNYGNDLYPVETLTTTVFGLISLKDFKNKNFKKYRIKFPDYIYKIIKE